MSNEFLTRYSTERTDEICTNLDREIGQAGSVSDYLLAVQVEQARTPNGRAELLRLQRTGAFATAPEGDVYPSPDSPDAQAYYHGALLSSVILSRMSEKREFNGGTLAHNNIHFLTKDSLYGRSFPANSIEGIAARTAFVEYFQDDLLGWSDAQDDEGMDMLQLFSDKYIGELYKGDEDMHWNALLGFWLPIREAFDPAAGPKKEYTGEAIVESPMSPLTRERDLIMRAFYELREGAPELSDEPDDDLKRYIAELNEETALNGLNKSNDLIGQNETLYIGGTYYCIRQDGEEVPIMHSMPSSTEIFGNFDSITVVDVPLAPGALGIVRPETFPDGTEMISTPAIVLRNPTYITTEEYGEVVTQPEDTKVMIPLAYLSVDISRES